MSAPAAGGGAGASPLANIITQVPQSGPAFSATSAARPIKVKKKKQDSVSASSGTGAAAPTDAPSTSATATTTTTTDATSTATPVQKTNRKASAPTTPAPAVTTTSTPTSARSTPLTPAEAAAQAAANIQQKQALAPPRSTSRQPRKSSAAGGGAPAAAPARTTSANASATPTAAAAAAAAAAPASTSTAAAPAGAGSTAATTGAAPPPTSRSQAFTTTAPKSSTSPDSTATAAAAAPGTKSEANGPSITAKRAPPKASPKPSLMSRIIAVLTCSSPTHIASASEDSACTLTGPAAAKKSYEATNTAHSTLDKSSTGITPSSTNTAGAAVAVLNEKSPAVAGLKPPVAANTAATAAAQPPSTPIKKSGTSNTLAVPGTAATGTTEGGASTAPPSPTPSTIAGGTRLPREETGDVTSGAVVPPGASYVPASGAGNAVNMVRLPSAVDGVPSLATVASGGAANGGSSTPQQHKEELAGLGVLAASAGAAEHKTTATAVDPSEGQDVEEEMETDEEEEEEEEEVHHAVGHMEDDEYELSEETLEEQRLIAQGGNGIPLDEDGNPHPLLVPIIEKDSGRKCLVLDLDETLVHSSFKMIQNADFIVPVEIEGHFHNVYVIKRPGVDEFMRRMGEIYEVVVFTASLSKYADPVLDMLDIHHVVRHRLFRESCFNHKGNYVKDLSQLGRPIGETLILDNSPASYIFHPNNAVPISSWFNDPHDTELVDLCEFLRDLSVVDDVRTVLDGAL